MAAPTTVERQVLVGDAESAGTDAASKAIGECEGASLLRRRGSRAAASMEGE
jgi:hypothetical protein